MSTEEPDRFKELRELIQREEAEERTEKFAWLRKVIAASKPTMEERIVQHLEAHPGASVRQLRRLGKSENVTKALVALESGGRIVRLVNKVGKSAGYNLCF